MADQESAGETDAEEWTIVTEELLADEGVSNEASSANAADYDQPCEVKKGDTSHLSSQNQGIIKDANEKTESATAVSSVPLESATAASSVPLEQEEADDESSIISCSSSDIDILDDKLEEFTSSLSSSTHPSDFSFIGTSVPEFSFHSLGTPDIQGPHDSSNSSTLSQNQSELNADMDQSLAVHQNSHGQKISPRSDWKEEILGLLIYVAIISVCILCFFVVEMNRQSYQQLLSNDQVTQLRRVQDELIRCMDEQNGLLALQKGNGEVIKSKYQPIKNFGDINHTISSICYTNSDYWKGKFEQLFSENRGLKHILEQIQHQLANSPPTHSKDLVNLRQHCSEDAKEEFEKLKLDLLVKQVEHLQLLKTCEKVKTTAKFSKERLKKLEEENSQLKTKLKDDKLIVELEEKLHQLEEENIELKSRIDDDVESNQINELEERIQNLLLENQELNEALQQLQNQIDSAQPVSLRGNSINQNEIMSIENDLTKDKPAKQKLNSLRRKVNQVVADNEELKRVIAQLRYGQQGLSDNSKETKDSTETLDAPTNVEQKTSPDSTIQSLQKQLESLAEILQVEKNETEKWKERYEHLQKTYQDSSQSTKDALFDMIPSINWTAISNGDYIVESNIGQTAKKVMDYINEHHENVSQEIQNQLNITLSAFLIAYHNVIEKWEEVKNSSEPMSKTKKVMNRMTDVLNNVYKKFQHAGEKFVTNQKPLKEKMNKLVSKTMNMIDGLGKKWTEIRDKISKHLSKAEKKTKTVNLEKQDKLSSHDTLSEEENLTGDFVTAPADFHVLESEEYLSAEHENWFLQRGRMRKQNQKYVLEENVSKQKMQWMFERAKDREKRRKSSSASLQAGDNWYTRRAKGRAHYRKSEDDEFVFIEKSSSCAAENCHNSNKHKTKAKRKHHNYVDNQNSPVFDADMLS